VCALPLHGGAPLLSMTQYRIGFRTFGCRLNQYETDMMRGLLEPTFEITESAADVYLLNACTVTGLAERKARQAARRLRREHPACRIVLIGCLADAVSQGTTEFVDADLLAGNVWKPRVRDVIHRVIRGASGLLPEIENTSLQQETVPGISGRVRAFQKIQDGCARACTYCRTTQVRGLPRSKPLVALHEEALRLVNSGIPEIVFTGIDLAQYHATDGNLGDAVRCVAGIPGLSRLRLASLNPSGITNELLDAFEAHEKACRHFHVPLQSGDDRVLARMRRGYTSSTYRRAIERVRTRFPEATFGADVIVGFPGETEEAFEHTLQLVREVGYLNLHIFRFSPRAGTEAASYTDCVPAPAAQARAAVLLSSWTAQCEQALDKQMGSTQDVLVEAQRDGRWRGYTSDYTFASFPSEQAIPIGAVRAIRVTGRQGTQLEGVVNHRTEAD